MYIVSLAADPEATGGLAECPISRAAADQLLAARPGLTVDHRRPTAEELSQRVSAYWMPDEVVLYVGKADVAIGARVDAYYKTRLGDRGPHAGGYWIKLLSVLPNLHVHFAESAEPQRAEGKMVSTFAAAVSPMNGSALHDPLHPYPFANLEHPGTRVRKRHGIEGAKAPKHRRR